VPCSGLGVVKDNPDIKLNRTEENIEELNDIQSNILNVCSNYVKVGGRLIYSTCSILPQENQEQITNFLSKNKNFVLEEIDSKLDGIKGVGITFLPHISLGAGFYVCALRRIK
ncbi:MAG: 16S rRNA (cytosine(967)-C(5))-methyltransferase RsmB, partial [Clostridia bacterium]|nr:16S rRNA (cytosine(967)-C(5))-methyltransferase RsmB [Clostridia bacterium]